MKYCLSIRQPQSTLKQADEIKLQYKDNDILKNYIETFPNATFIIVLDPEDEIDWTLLDYYIEVSKNRIVACLESFSLMQDCIKHKLPYYWKYPASSYFEANGLVKCDVCYLYITAPLTHDLPEVSKYNIPIRMSPDIAYDNYIPRNSGTCGQYVRPEDVSLYENFVQTFEFVESDLTRQRTLFKIYTEREWKGDLSFIVKNLGEHVDNRGFPVDFAARRIGCKQRCQLPGNYCDYCNSTFRLIHAAEKLANSYRESASAPEVDNSNNI